MGGTNTIALWPLTHPQKRIWYIEKVYPETSMYNMGGCITIKGSIHLLYLETAINTFIMKNDGVRLRFRDCNGEIRQYINEYQKNTLDFWDFSGAENPWDQWKQRVAREVEL